MLRGKASQTGTDAADVLSKEEIKSILEATGPDIRLFCMFSLLYSAGLRISELLDLKPHTST